MNALFVMLAPLPCGSGLVRESAVAMATNSAWQAAFAGKLAPTLTAFGSGEGHG